MLAPAAWPLVWPLATFGPCVGDTPFEEPFERAWVGEAGFEEDVESRRISGPRLRFGCGWDWPDRPAMARRAARSGLVNGSSKYRIGDEDALRLRFVPAAAGSRCSVRPVGPVAGACRKEDGGSGLEIGTVGLRAESSWEVEDWGGEAGGSSEAIWGRRREGVSSATSKRGRDAGDEVG